MKTSRDTLIPLLAAVITAGCMGDGDPGADGFVHFDEINGSADYLRSSLCGVLADADSAGLYRVTEIKARPEYLEGPDQRLPVTYITFERLEGWTADADETVVVRTIGGPEDSGVIRGWHIELAVDEVLGVVFHEPTPYLGDFVRVDGRTMFKGDDEEGFASEHFFSEDRRAADELEGILAARIDQPDCEEP
jgi:hypothetical protein